MIIACLTKFVKKYVKIGQKVGGDYMKIDANFGLMILRLVLCNEKMLAWLKAEAAKTETPIDDTAIRLIEMVVCSSESSG
jgi:hypothetical protein